MFSTGKKLMLPSNDTVTVIMPTYNRAATIRESVGSVLAQTYPHWELLIVDDGSTDDTPVVISSFGDPRIKYYRLAHTGSVGRTRNFGLSQARGSLIAFNDSDDLWHPEKLERQVAALRQFPEAGFCVTNGYNFRDAGMPLEYFYAEQQGLLFGQLFHRCFQSGLAGFTQALMFRRNCLEKTGGFRESRFSSDFNFIVSLAFHFKGLILFEPLTYRRIHVNNRSSGNWLGNYENGLALIAQYKKHLPQELRKEALFRLYINFGETHLLHGNKARAISKFFKAWLEKPYSLAPFKKTVRSILL